MRSTSKFISLILRHKPEAVGITLDKHGWADVHALIGGLLEMNETYEEAALREIREETGLEVRLDSFLGIFHNHNMIWSNGDAAHVISAMYTASIVSGEPRVDEESYELRFFSRDEIPDLFAEDQIAALDAYFKGVRYPLLRENRLSEQAMQMERRT